MTKSAILAILLTLPGVAVNLSAQVTAPLSPQAPKLAAPQAPTLAAPIVLIEEMIEDEAELLPPPQETQPELGSPKADSPLRDFAVPDIPPPDAPTNGVPTDGVPDTDQPSLRTVPEETPEWTEEFSSSRPTIGHEHPVLPTLDSGSIHGDACDCGHPGCDRAAGQTAANHWTPWQGLHSVIDSVDLKRFDIGQRFRSRRTRDRGIGYERVQFAPQILDPAIKTTNLSFRYQLDYGLDRPDRSEFVFGSVANTNAQAERTVDIQDLSVRLTVGNEKAVALARYTLRSLDPEANDNTTGFSDLVIGAQALVFDGQRTKISTIFETYLPTGNSQKGLGTGNTSLEYGLLARYCVAPETYLFAQAKYFTPLGGTPNLSGDVFSTGWGISTIAAESDVFAVLPTLEFRTLTFLFGGQTAPTFGAATASDIERIDGLTAVEIYPGARFVLGPENRFGVWEFGFAAGFTVADGQWFDNRWVFDLRLTR